MQESGGEPVLTGLLVSPPLPRAGDAPQEQVYMPQLRAVLAEETAITLTRAKKLTNPAKISKSLAAEVQDASFLLADLSRHAPSVYMYMGLAKALKKTIVTLRCPGKAQVRWVERVSDFVLDYEPNRAGLEELGVKLREVFRALLSAEALDHQVLMGNYQRGVEVEIADGATDAEAAAGPSFAWSGLSAKEHENLCQELLFHDGMESLHWLETTHEISIVALRPLENRTNDFFLVSIGGGLDDDFTVQMWAKDFQEVFPHIASTAERQNLRRAEGYIVLNVLFVWTPESTVFNVTQESLQALFQRISQIGNNLFTLRCTIWDRKRLESLVRQRPMLVRKYFTREWHGVAEDRRKSSEELYREAAAYCERAAQASQELEKKYGVDPGKKWQNLAYTATHSIGNAIFPVETYIDFLRDIMEEIGHEDGKVAADRAWTNVEKAKVHIRKFKSIASSKEHWHLTAVDVVPHLQASLDHADSRGVRVQQFFEEHPLVLADRDLVDEMTDEMVANAVNWLEGVDAPAITVILRLAAEDDLPPYLGRSPRKFLWMRFEDNGPGVAQEMKDKVFDLFFSRSSHGMGFGLSIVRKSMRIFGGEIVETGTPGQGARFDLFFPLYQDSPRDS